METLSFLPNTHPWIGDGGCTLRVGVDVETGLWHWLVLAPDGINTYSGEAPDIGTAMQLATDIDACIKRTVR